MKTSDTQAISQSETTANAKIDVDVEMQSSEKKSRFDFLKSRRFFIILFLGQLLSLCITATNVTTNELFVNYQISIPTTQTFFNYVLLGVVYTTITIYKTGFRGWFEIMRKRAPYYILLAIVDVEGNYFVVKAFAYTSLLSAMLLDAWTIPCVVVISFFLLKARYHWTQYVGVVVCLIGLGLLVWSDVMTDKNWAPVDAVKGDIFCVIGATFYAISNVAEEFFVRKRPLYEVVGQLGFWGMIVNGIQLSILERKELSSINFTGGSIGSIVVYNLAMFCLYSFAPTLFRMSSATFFNLSLLTSDFYGLLFGIFLFQAKVHALYPFAYILVIVGIIIYNIYPAPEPGVGNYKENAIAESVEDGSLPKTEVSTTVAVNTSEADKKDDEIIHNEVS